MATFREAVATAIADLYAWTQRIGVSASGALSVRSAAGRTEIEGGPGATLLPAARQTDGIGVFYFDTNAVGLWWSPTQAPHASWVQIANGAAPPTLTTPGTVLVITGGSARVTIA